MHKQLLLRGGPPRWVKLADTSASHFVSQLQYIFSFPHKTVSLTEFKAGSRYLSLKRFTKTSPILHFGIMRVGMKTYCIYSAYQIITLKLG